MPARRHFGSVRRLASGRWQARYRTEDGRMASGGTFPTRRDAERWLSGVETDLARGELDTPSATTVAELAERWFAGLGHLKPSTRRDYGNVLRVHLLPTLGHIQVGDVDPARLRSLLAAMTSDGKAPGAVSGARKVMRLVFGLAVEAGEIRSNPAIGLKVPRSRREEMHFLTHAQVALLADEIAHPPTTRAGNGARTTGRSEYPGLGVLVRLAAYSGLRAGEIEGLRARRVAPGGRRVEVAESLTEVGGKLVFGEPKTYQRRSVPLPGSIAAETAALTAYLSPDDLVFEAPPATPSR